MSKSKAHSRYSLEKKQEFFPQFRKFLVEMGIGDEDSLEVYSFGKKSDEWGEATKEDDDISKYVDRHFYFNSDSYSVDVVFGTTKIFLIVNSDKGDQKIVGEKVQKFLLI